MKKRNLLQIAMTVIATLCLIAGLTVSASAETNADWIKITPDSKYVYTVGADGTVAGFTFGAANNCHTVSLVVDLGTKADGTTAEADQKYVVSGVQLNNPENFTSAKISVSTDGETWEEVLDTPVEKLGWQNFNFEEVNARYVKVTPSGAWATLWGADYCIAVYGKAGEIVAEEEVNAEWLKVGPNTKYIYTVDAEGNKVAFSFNAGNNCNGLTLMVDLGMKADGVTAETAQCYILSGIQFRNLANTNSVVVEVSTDGEKYTTVLDTADVTGEYKTNYFGEVNARFVKITPVGQWQTFWGTDYAVAFLCKEGQIEETADPEGISIEGYDANTVYPLVKGDSIKLVAKKQNPAGDGEITYAITEGQTVATVTENGVVNVATVGDGETVYTVTASIPNPAGGEYQTTFKFVVVEEELVSIPYYVNAGTAKVELCDMVSVKLVRASGEATVKYSVDDFVYENLTANTVLETPVVAQVLTVDGGNVAIYGVKEYGKATAAAVTSENINGFYPEHPLDHLVDSNLDTFAQTPKGNFMGEDVIGSITVQLDAFYDVYAVRVFAFWNTLGAYTVSFSNDGVNFFEELDGALKYTKLGNMEEYYFINLPFEAVRAKYVRINIEGFNASSNDDFVALREITAYGEKVTDTVNVTFEANNQETVENMPQGGEKEYGFVVEQPANPTCAGFNFVGWYKEATCENAVTFPVTVVEDTTFYAKWEEKVTYAVTVEVEGQGTVTGAPETAVEVGTQVTITVTAAEGWSVKQVTVAGQTVELENGAYTFAVNAQTAVTVVFEENQTSDTTSDTTSEPTSDTTSEPTSQEPTSEQPKGCMGSAGVASIMGLAMVAFAVKNVNKKRK